MKQRATRFGAGRELLDWLHRADLVVHPHHRNDGDVRTRQFLERRPVDDSIGRHATEALLRAFLRRLVHRAEHRFMLDRRGDDRVPSLSPTSAPPAENGEIVRFSSTGRKAHLVRASANAAGKPLPRFVQGCASLAPPPMQAGGVAKPGPVKWRHGLQNLGSNRGRGSVVQVDRLRHGNNIRVFGGRH